MPRAIRFVREERASSRCGVAPPPATLACRPQLWNVLVVPTACVPSYACVWGVTACGLLFPQRLTCALLDDVRLREITVSGPQPMEERTRVLLGFYP